MSCTKIESQSQPTSVSLRLYGNDAQPCITVEQYRIPIVIALVPTIPKVRQSNNLYLLDHIIAMHSGKKVNVVFPIEVAQWHTIAEYGS